MIQNFPSQVSSAPEGQRGATLIELMVALLLGLVVVGAAGGLFLTNKRVYASTETLNRIQENGRVSFELMSRDLREAGGNPCGANSQLVNQLTTGDSALWIQYGQGLRGYEAGTAAPGTVRAAGTDAVDIHVAGGAAVSVISHEAPDADLLVTEAAGIATGDVLLACNTQYSLVFTATGVVAGGSGVAIQHAGGGTGSAMENCTADFQWERNCTAGAGSSGYCFLVPTGVAADPDCSKFVSNPAQVSKVETYRWFVADNGRSGRSLYRSTLVNNTATVTPSVVETVEIAEGISDLQLEYRDPASGTWRTAAAVADWSVANAVRVTFTTEGTEGALGGRNIEGTDGEVLSRQTTHVVAIRNREGVL